MELKRIEKSVNFWIGKPIAWTAFALFATARYAFVATRGLSQGLKARYSRASA